MHLKQPSQYLQNGQDQQRPKIQGQAIEESSCAPDKHSTRESAVAYKVLTKEKIQISLIFVMTVSLSVKR